MRMTEPDSYTPIEGRVDCITKRAVLITVGVDEVWVPISVIVEEDVSDLEVGEDTEINVATWFAAKEGLL